MRIIQGGFHIADCRLVANLPDFNVSPMKSKIVAALFAFAMIFTSACEQQKWSDTQKLFKGHEEKAGEHGKTDTHGEKKADEHAPKKDH